MLLEVPQSRTNEMTWASRGTQGIFIKTLIMSATKNSRFSLQIMTKYSLCNPIFSISRTRKEPAMVFFQLTDPAVAR